MLLFSIHLVWMLFPVPKSLSQHHTKRRQNTAPYSTHPPPGTDLLPHAVGGADGDVALETGQRAFRGQLHVLHRRDVLPLLTVVAEQQRPQGNQSRSDRPANHKADRMNCVRKVHSHLFN